MEANQFEKRPNLFIWPRKGQTWQPWVGREGRLCRCKKQRQIHRLRFCVSPQLLNVFLNEGFFGGKKNKREQKGERGA